jgi:hypothetical protein
MRVLALPCCSVNAKAKSGTSPPAEPTREMRGSIIRRQDEFAFRLIQPALGILVLLLQELALGLHFDVYGEASILAIRCFSGLHSAPPKGKAKLRSAKTRWASGPNRSLVTIARAACWGIFFSAPANL